MLPAPKDHTCTKQHSPLECQTPKRPFFVRAEHDARPLPLCLIADFHGPSAPFWRHGNPGRRSDDITVNRCVKSKKSLESKAEGREMLACFDEPDPRAGFRISLHCRSGKIAGRDASRRGLCLRARDRRRPVWQSGTYPCFTNMFPMIWLTRLQLSTARSRISAISRRWRSRVCSSNAATTSWAPLAWSFPSHSATTCRMSM